MINQQIRPSQFITTYGPGSILETPSGPVVLHSVDRVFLDHGLNVQDFEIRDARLTRDPAINGAGIVRLPTNAELGREQEFALYPTEALPYWSLCVTHGVLYFARGSCPQCPSSRGVREAREKAGREAIRFIRICETGHLDDVDWDFVIHNGAVCAGQPGFYLWLGGGGSLRNVELRCPQCRAQTNFGLVYSRSWRCSERYPERGPRPPQSACNSPARIVQRGAANVRISTVMSALTIPPLSSRLHNVLQDSRIVAACGVLQQMGMLDEGRFRQAVASIPNFPAAVSTFLQEQPWAQIRDALADVMSQATGQPRALKDEEFDSLRFAAANGVPPVPSSQVGVPPLFEVRAAEVRRFEGPGRSCTFRVAPVNRLRMVTVQLGYRRLDPSNSPVIPSSFQWAGRAWYPGVELFGEGLFVDLEDQELSLEGERSEAWTASYIRQNSSDLSLHPVHVWWHTLSHRLLRSLSVDSGYSSAAVRERVYIRLDPDGSVRGGLLLYTAQPGGDGTLGGMIALAPMFDRLLQLGLSDLSRCSNDPLCEEAAPNGVNGSACYSCLLSSETSCELRNIHLDRGLLLENQP